MGELRSDFIGRTYSLPFLPPSFSFDAYSCRPIDPVTSVLPTQDAQTYLVATLDNHVRLMDCSTGKLLNDFTGHVNEAYRCRACFGHGEATVICGDEKGQIWAWDLVDVSAGVIRRVGADRRVHRQKFYNPILLHESIRSLLRGQSIIRPKQER